MTYKQIEASREVRLWIGQVIVPAIGFGVMIMSNPQAKYAVKSKVDKAKRSVKNKFNKNEGL